MDRSFRSFEDILPEIEAIFRRLDRTYWAHIHEQKSPELLFQHSRLVADYFEEIVRAHGIEPIVDQVICQYCRSARFRSPQEAGEIIKRLFAGTIILHDLGKVNTNFQTHLGNPEFSNENLAIKHFHAFPGAYLFCVIHFQQIFSNDTLPLEDKNLLAFTTLCFSIPIIKHHASALDYKTKFDQRHILDECQRLLNSYHISAPQHFTSDIFNFVEELSTRFRETADSHAFLHLYVLIKLSYSLLTASDFLATNEFMADISVTDFGLINDQLRQIITTNFRSTIRYNADLFKSFDHFQSFPLHELRERSNANLNTLRQKIAADALSAVRGNAKSRWYYLEAPTGAGKTNLAIGCIAELLSIDRSLNKVFYVLPFTTLITQTFQSIKEVLNLNNTHIIQLHSKTGLHKKSTDQQEIDANYGTERTLYLDHLFANYPIVIASHVRFFDIIKGNEKETNYLFHRLCNSIVVLDEIQSYNPRHWDKMVYFIHHYAEMLNIRFLIMSATLPKIDQLSHWSKGKFVNLIQNADRYFQNPNFIDRIEFDFSLLDSLKHAKSNKVQYFEALAEKIKKEAEAFASANCNKVRVLVEFITKNTASKFFNYINTGPLFSDYKIYILSGDILEPRRRELIRAISGEQDAKVVLISTQVVEAGVNIDMDIGFKNRAILDSDEQFAGRINRNASKQGCKVFLFELDNIKTIYGKDERFRQQQLDDYVSKNWKEILTKKKFHELYEKVFEERLREDWTDGDRFPAYLHNFMRLDFRAIHNDFTLIEDNQTVSIFIPKEIDIPHDFEDIDLLHDFGVITDRGKISGEKVFSAYEQIIARVGDIMVKKIHLKKIAGLVSLFTVNLYPNAVRHLESYFDPQKERFGFKYLLHHKIYSYENGFDMSMAKNDVII